MTESKTHSTVEVASWITGSIVSSVGLILVNKIITNTFNFKFVFALTAFHFFFTAIGMEIMCILGMFKRQYMPFKDSVYMAVMCIGSVAFMNFSLAYNTVGFYQVTKLLCIPCMVFIQTSFYSQKFSSKIRFILSILLLGVCIATVTDMHLNAKGFVYGIFAVIFTAQFQIMQGEKQSQHKLNAMQINHANAPLSFVFCTFCSLAFEFYGDQSTNILLHEFVNGERLWILYSCILAIAVNLCSYGLIGKTSSVTYQVVGHAKTCLVLLGGYIMFPVVQSNSQLLKNLFGICVAMAGVILYGHVKSCESTNPKTEDWLDRNLPSTLLNYLQEDRHDGYRYEVLPTKNVDRDDK